MPARFGTGSNSNGQFWYGSTTNFPGFLYKKNVGVGARRSTKLLLIVLAVNLIIYIININLVQEV